MIDFYEENIELTEKDRKYSVCLTVMNTNNANDLLNAANQYLSTEEMQLFNTMKMNKRKYDFLLGRVCAKLSIAHLKKIDNPQKINIGNGYYRQPFIKNSGIINCQLSITHNEIAGAAIAFPEEIPMGIDLEIINSTKWGTLISQLTEHEKREVILYQNDIRILTVLWTAKEAVSKLLKIGFTSPISIFEVDKINLYNQSINCSFVNFPQIQTVSACLDEYVITLALPSKMDITLDWSRLTEYNGKKSKKPNSRLV